LRRDKRERRQIKKKMVNVHNKLEKNRDLKGRNPLRGGYKAGRPMRKIKNHPEEKKGTR